MNREVRTISQMIELYCRDKHEREGNLCPECSDLLEYAKSRLSKCRFKVNKPTCAKCPVHCYSPPRRKQIREVMRHSGPRMLLRHPISFLRHGLAGVKGAPRKP